MLGGGVAGIYNVTTASDVRRRGFGAALTATAIAEGRERGFEVAVLGSSELGYGVYERMGFAEACRDRVWVLPVRKGNATSSSDEPIDNRRPRSCSRCGVRVRGAGVAREP